MKKKLFLAIGFLLLFMTGCMVAPAPMVTVVGNETVISMGGARFIVPPGFLVVEAIPPREFGQTVDSIAFLARDDYDENGTYTVIEVSHQTAAQGLGFNKLDLKQEYPDAVQIDTGLGFLHSAATHLDPMVMSRKYFLENPICVVLTGYRYEGDSSRYRIDVYRNIEDTAFELCCEKKRKKTDVDKKIEDLKTRKKDQIDAFRKEALSLIKDHFK